MLQNIKINRIFATDLNQPNWNFEKTYYHILNVIGVYSLLLH